MKVGANTMVEIEYTVTLDSGEVVEGGEQPARYSFIFETGQIFPALERKLKDLEPGDTTEVTLAPVEAFGEIKSELMKKVALSEFPPDLEIEIGHMYRTVDSKGNPMYFSVKEKDENEVLLDFNHPLAGKTLHFKVLIADVRPASSEELAKAFSLKHSQ
ncbi:MAG: peptidylprolyl isomerase [Candidatus Desulfofervidus sp.]|nr:peptidylprolyl isomerase [Candidatus Desulfofervidus sp.]